MVCWFVCRAVEGFLEQGFYGLLVVLLNEEPLVEGAQEGSLVVAIRADRLNTVDVAVYESGDDTGGVR